MDVSEKRWESHPLYKFINAQKSKLSKQFLYSRYLQDEKSKDIMRIILPGQI